MFNRMRAWFSPKLNVKARKRDSTATIPKVASPHTAPVPKLAFPHTAPVADLFDFLAAEYGQYLNSRDLELVALGARFQDMPVHFFTEHFLFKERYTNFPHDMKLVALGIRTARNQLREPFPPRRPAARKGDNNSTNGERPPVYESFLALESGWRFT